jgi:hypothetical protein
MVAPETMEALSTTLQSAQLSEVVPHPNSVPITLTRSYKVQSIATDIFVQLFSDRIVCGITQLNTKIGTYLSCHIDESAIDNRIRYHVEPVLGKRDDNVAEVFCRQVAQQIQALRTTAGQTCPAVLLGISLKQTDPESFRVLVSLVVNLYNEAIQLASST